MEAEFGPADWESEPLAFDYTHYYDQELGSPLTRRVIAFADLAPMDCLPDRKWVTHQIEQRFSRADGSRTFNLDPGLLSYDQTLLATGKPKSYRIYLRRGVWAHLALIYKGGLWRPPPWTFPDYASPEMTRLFGKLRDRYRRQRMNLNPSNEQNP